MMRSENILLCPVLLIFVYADSFQELTEVNTISKKLFSHFIQIPSAAIQIKDIMLSAPPTKRQQLQVLCISTDTHVIVNLLDPDVHVDF